MDSTFQRLRTNHVSAVDAAAETETQTLLELVVGLGSVRCLISIMKILLFAYLIIRSRGVRVVFARGCEGGSHKLLSPLIPEFTKTCVILGR